VGIRVAESRGAVTGADREAAVLAGAQGLMGKLFNSKGLCGFAQKVRFQPAKQAVGIKPGA
jgi:hypothetical protein